MAYRLVSNAVDVYAGASAAEFVQAAFSALIPTPTDIGGFINKQSGNKFSYLVNTLLNGSPGKAPALQ